MMPGRLSTALQVVGLTVVGVTGLYFFHQWREPHRKKAPTAPPRAPAAAPPEVLRLGYFPNITHAPALVGLARGTFQQALGAETPIRTMTFNAGPSAVEAVFSDAVDLVYIGPNPAINAYMRSLSRGGAVRIVAGAASGGASLVVRADAGIASPADFRGRKVATPQLGNTQDVAARSWLRERGYDLERDLTVLPLASADQLSLFVQKELDAAWTVEPWVSRLVREGGGRVFLDERSLWPGGAFTTTLVLVRTAFLERHPDTVKLFLRAHVDTVRWIDSHPGEAQKIVNAEFARLTGKAIREDVLADAFTRLRITYDPVGASLAESARRAFELGFLGKDRPDLAGLQDLRLLNEVLRESGFDMIK